MDRLAFERDARGAERAVAPYTRIAIAVAIVGGTALALVIGADPVARGGAEPVRAAFDEPPTGRPGRRY